jgi:hypothetical protein
MKFLMIALASSREMGGCGVMQRQLSPAADNPSIMS